MTEAASSFIDDNPEAFEASHELAELILATALRVDCHPQIFTCRVVGSIIALIQINNGLPLALSTMRSLDAMFEDIREEIEP